MFKRFIFSLMLCLIAFVMVGGMALADDGGNNITLGPIVVTGDTVVGNTVTVSGMVNADVCCGYGYYNISNSDGIQVSNYQFSPDNPGYYDGGVWNWSTSVLLSTPGTWTVQQGGSSEDWRYYNDDLTYGNWATPQFGSNTGWYEYPSDVITTLTFTARQPQTGNTAPMRAWQINWWNSKNVYYVSVGDLSYTACYKVGGDKTLLENVSLEGRYQKDSYRVLMDKGTKITIPNQDAKFMEVQFRGGEIFIEHTVQSFSKPVTIQKAVNGKWVDVVKFTEVVAGKPVPVK